MRTLWLSTAKNILIAIILTAVLMLAMWAFNVLSDIIFGFNKNLNEFELTFDKALICSILATVFGITYLLSIRNPENYTGFYLGILSSSCLGVQFAFLGNYDLTFLYFTVFIPFQYAAIMNWKKKSVKNSVNEPFNPKFLPFKRQLFFFVLFLAIILMDYIFASKVLKNDDFWLKIMLAIMISSSILANYLMIGKWFDTWIYWILYSISAIFSAIIIQNNFNLLLFVFFLIINIISFISWLKIHPKNF